MTIELQQCYMYIGIFAYIQYNYLNTTINRKRIGHLFVVVFSSFDNGGIYIQMNTNNELKIIIKNEDLHNALWICPMVLEQFIE